MYRITAGNGPTRRPRPMREPIAYQKVALKAAPPRTPFARTRGARDRAASNTPPPLESRINIDSLSRWELIKEDLEDHFYEQPENDRYFKIEVLKPNYFEARQGYLLDMNDVPLSANSQICQFHARGLIQLLDKTVDAGYHDHVILHCRFVTEGDQSFIEIDKLEIR